MYNQRPLLFCVMLFFCLTSGCFELDPDDVQEPGNPPEATSSRFTYDVFLNGESVTSYDVQFNPVERQDVQFFEDESCPETLQRNGYIKTRFSSDNLLVDLLTSNGYPLGIYAERQAAEICGERGPFYDVTFLPNQFDSSAPFISTGEPGTLEVAISTNSLFVADFDVWLFQMQDLGSGEYSPDIVGDSVRIQLKGRIFFRLRPG